MDPKLLIVVLLAAGCGSVGDPPGAARGGSVDVAPEGDAPPVDHPPGEAQLVSAGVRRLTVPQLRASFPVLMGDDASGDGLTWRTGAAKGLDKYSDTLGEADFLNTTSDAVDPSPLYAKLMDDAARSLCGQRLDLDVGIADASKRVILRFVGPTDTAKGAKDKVDANLRYLKLRLHGVKVTDDAALEPLRALFATATDAAAGSDPVTAAHVKEGWRAVCVALFVAPELHLY